MLSMMSDSSPYNLRANHSTQIGIVTSKSPVDTASPLPFTYRGCNLALTDEQRVTSLIDNLGTVY